MVHAANKKSRGLYLYCIEVVTPNVQNKCCRIFTGLSEKGCRKSAFLIS
jgi:hypothetical protein